MRRRDREITGIEEIESIINKTEVCRIALCDGDNPYMVAMNFGYKRGNPSTIHFHCAIKGRKIDIIKKNNKTFFQMDTDHKLERSDEACDFTMKYSSVTGSGKIFLVDTEEERQIGLNILMKQYSGRDDYSFKPGVMKRTMILRLEIDNITGKQVL